MSPSLCIANIFQGILNLWKIIQHSHDFGLLNEKSEKKNLLNLRVIHQKMSHYVTELQERK